MRAEAGGEASAAGRLRRDAVGWASLLGRLTASLLLPRLFVFGSRRARARGLGQADPPSLPRITDRQGRSPCRFRMR